MKMILAWKDELVTYPAERETVRVLRNLHTSEAYNAMIIRTARLRHLGRIQEVAKAWDELQELRKMPV